MCPAPLISSIRSFVRFFFKFIMEITQPNRLRLTSGLKIICQQPNGLSLADVFCSPSFLRTPPVVGVVNVPFKVESVSFLIPLIFKATRYSFQKLICSFPRF